MAVRVLIIMALVGAAGFYAHDLAAQRVFEQALPELNRLPENPGEWRSETFPLSSSIAEVLSADVTLRRRYYRADGVSVWVFVAYFAEQEVNAQIHSPRHCVPGSGWSIVSMTPETLALTQGVQVANRMLIDREGDTQELIYWFRTRGGTVVGEYQLKWDLVKNSLARRPTDAVFVRYLSPLEHSDSVRQLISQLNPPLNAILGEVGLQ